MWMCYVEKGHFMRKKKKKKEKGQFIMLMTGKHMPSNMLLSNLAHSGYFNPRIKIETWSHQKGSSLTDALHM